MWASRPGDFKLGTAFGGEKRVREVLLPWIARGLLKGEKTEQYFGALAKGIRTRDVFAPKDQRTGRRRQALKPNRELYQNRMDVTNLFYKADATVMSTVLGVLAQYEKICNSIFKYDRRIRYAGVLDQTGRLIAGGMRRGVPSLEPQSEDLRLIANITIQLSTDKTWDQYFGKTQFTFIKREKVNILTFNLGDKLLLVSTEPDFTLQQAQELRNTVVTNFSQIPA